MFHLHVKLQDEDRRLLDAIIRHRLHDTDAQAVRTLIRAEARSLGLTAAPADTMPPRGRPRAKKRAGKR